MNLADLADAVLEAPIAPSFTRLGYAVRQRLDAWTPLDAYDLKGRTVLVTGATSGLGRHAAEWFARLGASVIVTGRDAERTRLVASEIARVTGSEIVPIAADMGDLAAVRRLAQTVLASTGRLDALVHNAGALSAVRVVNADGIEATVASQVLGPFLLTNLLLEPLRAAHPGRVVTVSSGGMYAASSAVAALQMPPGEYRGSEQYARAKRAQVTLNQIWARRVPASDVVFHAMHPGWADTPGVKEALPRFRTLTKPLLRSLEQGADTVVWLACDPAPGHASGEFWHDRRLRRIHKLPTTRRSDTQARRQRLWEWCVERTGVDPA